MTNLKNLNKHTFSEDLKPSVLVMIKTVYSVFYLVFDHISLLSLLSGHQLMTINDVVNGWNFWTTVTSKKLSFWYINWPVLYNSQMYYIVCLPKGY